MAFLRFTLQVRSVPERIMEWVLIFIPLDLFEAGLRRFGFDAKRYALYGAIVATLICLALLGSAVLRRCWSPRAILALGGGLWLFVMMVVMPLTSAGFFALSLIDGTKAAAGGYFAVALTYATVLILARSVLTGELTLDRLTGGLAGPALPAPDGTLATGSSPRRSAVMLVGSTLAAYAGTFAAVRWGPSRSLTRVLVGDPQVPYPSGGIEPPNPHPNLAPTAQPRAAGAPSTGRAVEPPAARQLARDKDGAALPSGRRPGQLADLITSNDDFYIVTKNAAGDPVLNVNQWRLRIDGEVQRPVEVDYDSLRRLPAMEITKTLECISNFVAKCELAPFGCDLISTARWKGVRVSDVLALAGGVKPGAVSLATIAADEFTTSLPIDVALQPDTLLVYEMNGQVLPREHGYPVRMLVPGRYGMKNAKWIVALRVMSREFLDWYGQRNWSRQAIVKTMSRIDVPAPGAVLVPGEHRIAGIAYAGDRGVAKVEFSADGGRTWEEAQFLEPPAGRDVWVRWQGRFTLPPNAELTLVVRATDGTGALQTEAFSLPQPEGSSGWHSIEVRSRA